MERLRSFFCFNSSTPSTVILPISIILTKLPSRLNLFSVSMTDFDIAFAAAKREGLISLSKDKELCEGYADIKTMW
ncbi:DNA polymerase III subunit alpha [Bienertia sinuspersici]